MFSCEYYKIFKSTYFEKHLRTAAFETENIKGTVMQNEKALINDRLCFQNYLENFAFQLFIVLQ